MLARLWRGIRHAPTGPLVRGTDPALAAANLPRRRGLLEIVRDGHGVPHVYAEHEYDLFAALGYLQAADRFFFLDILRHLAAGRCTELIGEIRAPAKLELIGGKRISDIDGFLLPWGFEDESRAAFTRLPSREQECLGAFADGVNAALRASAGVYPPEYLLLAAPRPWHPADSLLTARACAFFVSLMALDHELTFDAIRGRLGDDVARHLFPEVPWEDAPTSYTPGPGPRPRPPVDPPSGGSNNWVVGGSRSRSGKPILANDPHVPLLPLPTFWYHVHLKGPQFDVEGGMFPGCPAFGFGHNRAMAWGVTTGYRDGWDLYRVHRLPGDSSRYRTVEGEGAITQHRRTLYARAGRAVTLSWESCEHGVLFPGWRHHDGVDLAVRFVSADPATYFQGCLALMAAETVADHQAAVAQLNEGPFDFNHTYAHRDGHFGWEIYGRLPRRRRDGLFIRDAQDPDAQWHGFLSFDEMPKILNPACGYVATANSYTDNGNYLSVASRSHYEPRFRQDRIEEQLAASSSHDQASMAALQRDVGTRYALPLRDSLLELMKGAGGSRRLNDPAALRRIEDAADILHRWNGHFDCDSAGAAVFVWTMMELGERLWRQLLGDKLGVSFFNGRKARPRLHRLLLDDEDPLRRDLTRLTGRSLADLTADAFAAAVVRVEKACGPAPVGWRWGDIQRAWLAAPLALLPGIGRFFVALDGGFPGDDFTVNPARPVPVGSRLYAFVGPSSRFICDLAEPEQAWFAHSSGPSGDAFSPYFRNLSRGWLEFEYFRSGLWASGDVPEVSERVRLRAPGEF